MSIPAETLDGTGVRLIPLPSDFAEGLRDAVKDGELWKLHFTLVPHPDGVDGFIDTALDIHKKGEGLAFATIDKKTGKVTGSTRFLNANLRYKRI